MPPNKQNQQCDDILGLRSDGLADLTVEEIVNNETAIKMLFHYYKKLNDENTGLKNEKNTLDTYVTAYEKQRDNSSISALLLILSNILIAFGINILTDISQNNNAGWILFGVGIIVATVGIYFNFFKGRK
jgi:hypothetical protein